MKCPVCEHQVKHIQGRKYHCLFCNCQFQESLKSRLCCVLFSALIVVFFVAYIVTLIIVLPVMTKGIDTRRDICLKNGYPELLYGNGGHWYCKKWVDASEVTVSVDSLMAGQ